MTQKMINAALKDKEGAEAEPERSPGAEHSGDASLEAAPGVRGGGATACMYRPERDCMYMRQHSKPVL